MPIEILAKWNRFTGELHLLSQIFIERGFRPHSFLLLNYTFTLLVFSNASLSALGAVAYLQTTCDRVHLSFVMTKGRIAPISVLALPGSKLQAAVLAVKFVQTIKKELQSSHAPHQRQPCDDCTRGITPKDLAEETLLCVSDSSQCRSVYFAIIRTNHSRPHPPIIANLPRGRLVVSCQDLYSLLFISAP